MFPNRLVRTDSTMINPSGENNLSNLPIGEIIMSPRKKHVILNELCNEIKSTVKKIN